MPLPASVEVAVIGGGPGGSTAATMLAKQGREVLLLERERFPRDHVGESLLPASMPILEELGVAEAVANAGFLKKWGASMVWGVDDTRWHWRFEEASRQYPHSYQVVRSEFDRILLDHAAASRVGVRQGARVIEVETSDDATSTLRVATDDGEATLEARFVVDASGQNGLIARSRGLRQWDEYFQNLAVYAYFADVARLDDPEETNILVEATEAGWVWVIPLDRPPHANVASVGVVLDARRAAEAIEGGATETFLREQLALTSETVQLLAGATLIEGPQVERDWSYSAERFAGEGWVLVGDAACFVDPLFSSGVHLAMSSAVLAAAYVHTALEDAELGRASAPVYEELYRTQYGHFHELARLFYSSNRTHDSYFWQARRITGDESYSPREAFVRAVAGQPPQAYERAVLDHGLAPEAFRSSVSVVAGDRDERREHVNALGTHLLDATPILAPGVEVARRPVLATGRFEWGVGITAPHLSEAIPASPLVASLIARIDGASTLRTIGERLVSDAGATAGDALDRALGQAAAILYVDGTIATLKGGNTRQI